MTRILSPALLAALPLLPLAACGEPQRQPKATPTVSGYIARVQALSPAQRQGVLFRAIQASPGNGQRCHAITQVESMPPGPGGQPIWRVTCTDGGQWAVALADNGIAQVTGAATR